ncbi:MAG: hypothetical protein ABWK15_03915 [Dissulfuribacterales bacterium]
MNARSRLEVAQGVYPLGEDTCFANFDHQMMVADWLHTVNAICAVLRYPT